MDQIRKDATAADLNITLIVLSLGVLLGFTIAVTDIEGAYIQSGPIYRYLYVHPAKQLKFHVH